MPVNEPAIPCFLCGLTPAECSCVNPNRARLSVVNVPSNYSAVQPNDADLTAISSLTSTSLGHGIIGSAGGAGGCIERGINTDGWGTYGTNTYVATYQCVDHVIDPECIEVVGDSTVGYCVTCHVKVTMPRIVGGGTFEKAGSLIGRAMTLDDEDENIGELLGELNLLEQQIDREAARYKRARGLTKIARDLVKNRAVADNARIE